MRILLTSTGLETTEIKDYFVTMVGKDMNLVKALFIPTAAINPDAIEVLPKCMHDLLKCGICKHNIAVYDLHYGMEINELSQYDLLYICGGDTKYLLQRVNETGFNVTLLKYIQNNGVVVGVSAGSIIFAENLKENLGLLKARLEVHCTEGNEIGNIEFPVKNTIKLTNTQALAIWDVEKKMEIIGK